MENDRLRLESRLLEGEEDDEGDTQRGCESDRCPELGSRRYPIHAFLVAQVVEDGEQDDPADDLAARGMISTATELNLRSLGHRPDN